MSRVRWLLFLGLLAIAAGGGWWFGRGLRGKEIVVEVPERTISEARVSPVFAAAGTAGGSWVARVKRAHGPEFPRLLAEWESAFPQDTERGEDRAMRALSWMYGVWATKDLAGFLGGMKSPDSGYDNLAAQALVRVFPGKAAELIAASARKAIPGYFVTYLSRELAMRNPELFLKQFPFGAKEDLGDWTEAVTALAKTDPRAAADACLVWGPATRPSNAGPALFAAVAAWREGDAALADWIAGISDPEMRSLAENARLAALAKKDPRAALAELAKVDLGETIYLNEGRDARLEIAAGLAKTDPAAAFALLRDAEAVFSKYPAGDPFSVLPAEKTPGLFGVFNDAGFTPKNNALRKAIVAALAENLPEDPAGVFGALQGMNGTMGDADEAWQRGLDADLIRQRIRKWPGAECLVAAEMWMSELGGAADDRLVRDLAARAAGDDPDAARAAVGNLPEAVRPVLAREIVKTLPAGHPEQRIELFGQLSAAQWDDGLGTTLGANGADYAAGIAALPAETTAGARESFLAKWGVQDPEAAARWVGGLPADVAAFPSGYGLALEWAGYDEYAASAWAATLPAGPARDGAAAALARTLAQSQPVTARQWAASISDPKKRTEAVNRFAQAEIDPFADPEDDGN